MWTRKEIKERAKQLLKKSYWKAFLVSAILALAAGGGAASGFRFPNFNWKFNNNSNQINLFNKDIAFRYVPEWKDNFPEIFNNNILQFLIAGMFIVMFIIIAILVSLALRILLGYAIEVGARRFFSQMAVNNENMNYLGFSFEKGKYFKIVKSMLWKDVIVFLWSLLFIIPGIIKHYAYSMVPYILADNPEIGSSRALELSNNMTKGNKFKLFVLDLSFIGWYMLGAIVLFVGVLFVKPYEDTVKGVLYIKLRNFALNKYTDIVELNIEDCKTPELIETVDIPANME